MVSFLVAKGITSISLNPGALMRGLETVAAAEVDLRAPSGVAAAKARTQGSTVSVLETQGLTRRLGELD